MPIGSVLFIVSAMADTTIAKFARPLLPLFFTMVLVFLLMPYLLELSLWLPGLFGY